MENTLKVGDRVYSKQYGKIKEIFTIDRVSKLSAFSDSHRFKIEYSNGYIDPIPKDIYGPDYCIETPELKHKYRMQKIKERIRDMNVNYLSEYQMIQISNVLDSKDN